MVKIPFLGFDTQDFPPIDHALDEPSGLLAAGGDLEPETLLRAYSLGIFPWFEDDQPILWWSPHPRTVLFPHQLHISKSLRKTLKKNTYTVTMDQAFEAVIEACSETRAYSEGTWITPEMAEAYIRLHQMGFAHSVESWHEGRLVGGLYGIGLGSLFFGESMFSRASDASKVAFVHLVKQLEVWGCPLIDCQVGNPHLTRLGSTEIDRAQFKSYLQRYVPDFETITQSSPKPWQLHWKVSET